jgi:hypothetical protein
MKTLIVTREGDSAMNQTETPSDRPEVSPVNDDPGKGPRSGNLMTGLHISTRKLSLLEGGFGLMLRKLEARIVNTDQHSIVLRWEFGQELLKAREGKKKVPKGFLDSVAKNVKTSRSEVKKRLQLAQRYVTRQELDNAVVQLPTWHHMVARGLTLRTTRPRKPTPPAKPVASLELHRIERLLKTLQIERQTPANVEALRRIHAQLGLLLEAADRMIAATRPRKDRHHA